MFIQGIVTRSLRKEYLSSGAVKICEKVRLVKCNALLNAQKTIVEDIWWY